MIEAEDRCHFTSVTSSMLQHRYRFESARNIVAFASVVCYTYIKSNYVLWLKQYRDEEFHLRKISYKKLWKLLIDKDLNKQTLSQVANISASTLTKMSKNQYVNVEMLERICNALNCEFDDIIELVPDCESDKLS